MNSVAVRRGELVTGAMLPPTGVLVLVMGVKLLAEVVGVPLLPVTEVDLGDGVLRVWDAGLCRGLECMCSLVGVASREVFDVLW